MSHFVEAEFPMGVDPGEPEKPKTIEIVNPEKLAVAVEEIRAEIQRIERGQSKLVAYAISSGSFGFPADNVLTMLVAEPTKANIKAFIQISKQDFNDAVGKHFAKLLAPTLEEVPNV
jgi:hypothetical protein